MAKVYVHLLTWNDRRYLPDLFDSLETQSFSDIAVRVLDNGSTDQTVSFLQEKYPHALVARNVKNRGFAGGHNQLLQFTIEHLSSDDDDPFVLVLNSDMILHPDLIKHLVEALKEDVHLAAVQPKLYRAFGEVTGDDTLAETTESDILDTTGLQLKKGWRMADRGAGEMDKGQYDLRTNIFGPTGTCSLFRLSALIDIAVDREIFDDDFFAYREDCDLAWRLRKRGWKARFIPSATAHHYRGMFGAEKMTWWQRIVNRRGQRPFFAALSTRNQLFVLVKNLSFSEAIVQLPWIVMAEAPRVLYGLLFEKETRKRLIEVVTMLPQMWKKRTHIQSQATVSDAKLRSYVREA